ncbi:hypothetical protein D3C81_1288670 [compost metagenome]
MNILIGRPHHHGALHGNWRQVDAYVVGRNDGHAAPHGRHFNTHAQGAAVHFGHQLALLVHALTVQPTVARKQACHPGGQIPG